MKKQAVTLYVWKEKHRDVWYITKDRVAYSLQEEGHIVRLLIQAIPTDKELTDGVTEPGPGDVIVTIDGDRFQVYSCEGVLSKTPSIMFTGASYGGEVSVKSSKN